MPDDEYGLPSAAPYETSPLEDAGFVAYAPLLIDGERMLRRIGFEQSPGRLRQTCEDLQEITGQFGRFHMSMEEDGKPSVIGLSIPQFKKICDHYGIPQSDFIRQSLEMQAATFAGDNDLRKKIANYIHVSPRTRTEIRTRFAGVDNALLTRTLEQMVAGGELGCESVRRGDRGPKAERYWLVSGSIL